MFASEQEVHLEQMNLAVLCKGDEIRTQTRSPIVMADILSQAPPKAISRDMPPAQAFLPLTPQSRRTASVSLEKAEGQVEHPTGMATYRRTLIRRGRRVHVDEPLWERSFSALGSRTTGVIQAEAMEHGEYLESSHEAPATV
jgi:hypothetical protein